MRSLRLAFLLALPLFIASAQTHRSAALAGATWAKVYATDCGSAMKHPCPPSTNGYENEFNGDPRLVPLLKQSLPQHESWWINGYGGAAPVSSIVQQFIGVPNALTLDDNRYLTADGCVPHDCTTHGMLWIDTGTQPATVIFVGEDLLTGSLKGESSYHLYLYTSRNLATYYAGKRHIEIFAPNFLKSLARWQLANVSKYDDQTIILATIVWPNGRTQDIFWSDLIQPQTPSPNSTGAKQ